MNDESYLELIINNYPIHYNIKEHLSIIVQKHKEENNKITK